MFPGNKIPASRINPIANNVISRYPLANLPGDPFTGANNYFSEVPAPYDGENYSARVDPNIKRHRLFARWSHNQGFPGTPTPYDIGGGVGALEGNNRAQTSIGISDAFVLNPSTVITAQAGYTRWTQEGIHPNFDQTTLGFSKSLVSLMQQQIFPQFNNSDIYYIGTSEGQWFEHVSKSSRRIRRLGRRRRRRGRLRLTREEHRGANIGVACGAAGVVTCGGADNEARTAESPGPRRFLRAAARAAPAGQSATGTAAEKRANVCSAPAIRRALWAGLADRA